MGLFRIEKHLVPLDFIQKFFVGASGCYNVHMAIKFVFQIIDKGEIGQQTFNLAVSAVNQYIDVALIVVFAPSIGAKERHAGNAVLFRDGNGFFPYVVDGKGRIHFRFHVATLRSGRCSFQFLLFRVIRLQNTVNKQKPPLRKFYRIRKGAV